jgi:hypothetical protein
MGWNIKQSFYNVVIKNNSFIKYLEKKIMVSSSIRKNNIKVIYL